MAERIGLLVSVLPLVVVYIYGKWDIRWRRFEIRRRRKTSDSRQAHEPRIVIESCNQQSSSTLPSDFLPSVVDDQGNQENSAVPARHALRCGRWLNAAC